MRSVSYRVARKKGTNRSKLIKRILRACEERLFWQEVQNAFAKPEDADSRAERALWDRTASDGFRGLRP
jgi:hypothetical protein